jgi:alkylhydroperoxidase/carboxymuconolactone decarboxylase family protein
LEFLWILENLRDFEEFSLVLKNIIKIVLNIQNMSNTYYESSDLRKFGNITEWNEELGKKFFDYYGSVFEEGALSAREKSLIALAVSHIVKCPYCIDAYTQDGLKRGITKEEMMEAVHAGAAIESGATLVHSVQMMNKYKKLSM